MSLDRRSFFGISAAGVAGFFFPRESVEAAVSEPPTDPTPWADIKWDEPFVDWSKVNPDNIIDGRVDRTQATKAKVRSSFGPRLTDDQMAMWVYDHLRCSDTRVVCLGESPMPVRYFDTSHGNNGVNTGKVKFGSLLDCEYSWDAFSDEGEDHRCDVDNVFPPSDRKRLIKRRIIYLDGCEVCAKIVSDGYDRCYGIEVLTICNTRSLELIGWNFRQVFVRCMSGRWKLKWSK